MLYVQEAATMVLDHVRSVARTVVRRVGDGSTTAVVMSESLFRSFVDAGLVDRFPSGAVQAAMNACADAIAQCVRQEARRDDSDLVRVATIAANNDPEVGRIVAGVYATYGRDANVFVGTSATDETVVRPAPGYRILRGMAHDAFANTATTEGAAPTVCALANPVVLIYGGHVGMPEFVQTIMQAGNVVLSSGNAFVCVAQSFAPEVLDAAAKFRLKSPSIGMLLVDHAMAARKGASRLGDLATVLGATYVDGESAPKAGEGNASMEPAQLRAFMQNLGKAVSVRSTASETVFVLPAVRNPGAVARAQELDEQIERTSVQNADESLTEEIDELRLRRATLLGTEVTVLAGGATQQDKDQLQYLLDDAALACAAALRSGVVEGMGMTALRLLSSYPDDVTAHVTEAICERTRLNRERAWELAEATVRATGQAYLDAFVTVIENGGGNGAEVLRRCLDEGLAYDAMSGEYVAPGRTEVVNPADTDAEVLKGAMSIAAMLATSTQTVLVRPRVGNGQD
jgi:chaperonin GroEL